MIHVPIREECDVAVARRAARELASAEGFPENRAGALATAVSEIARNIIVHAGAGDLLLDVVAEHGRRGVLVVARDGSPGIADVDAAMRDGFSTGLGLGLGLPGAKRLMDEFVLTTAVGDGTTIVMKKWKDDPSG